MTVPEIINLLRRFYEETTGHETVEADWYYIPCELYLKSDHVRCRYKCGQEFPDYKFLLYDYSPTFAELPEHYQEIAEEIHRAANGQDIETIVISDRMSDGDVDYLCWES